MATDRRLDEIYDSIDDKLCAGDFEAVDIFLRQTDVSKLDLDELLGYLTATFPAKNKLPFRHAFYESVVQITRAHGQYRENMFNDLA